MVKIGLSVKTHSLQRICQQIKFFKKFNSSHKRRHDLWKRIHQLFDNAIFTDLQRFTDLRHLLFSFRFLFSLTNAFIFMIYVILFNCFLIHTSKVERVTPYVLVCKEDVWMRRYAFLVQFPKVDNAKKKLFQCEY